MLFTIGYEKLTPTALQRVVEVLKIAFLYDCRSVPQSRHAGFGKNQLAQRFGVRYYWAGLELGGRGDGPTEIGLNRLYNVRGLNVLLMCKEAAPGDCHRHFSIAVPLLTVTEHRTSPIDCIHVFQNEDGLSGHYADLILTSELQKELDDPRYEYKVMGKIDI